MSNALQLGLVFCVALASGLILASFLKPGAGSGFSCCGLNSRPRVVTTQGQKSAAGISAANSTQPVEVGNTICPVTGNDVTVMGGPIKIEYNGKIYNLCCPMCRGTFDSDPAYYAKIAEDKAAAK